MGLALATLGALNGAWLAPQMFHGFWPIAWELILGTSAALAAASFLLHRRLGFVHLAAACVAFLTFYIVWRLSPLYSTMSGKDAWLVLGGLWMLLCPLNTGFALMLAMAASKGRLL